METVLWAKPREVQSDLVKVPPGATDIDACQTTDPNGQGSHEVEKGLNVEAALMAKTSAEQATHQRLFKPTPH